MQFHNRYTPNIVLVHLAVRLAGEGVPIGAISRITSLSSAAITTTLTEAIGKGALRSMPAEEWPHGSMIEARAPTVPPIIVDDITDLALRIVTQARCANNPARVVAALLIHGRLSQRALMDIVWLPGNEISFKTLHSVCSDARKVVGPLGAEILAIRGNGHFIPPEQRTALLKHFGVETGDAVAA